MSHKETLTKFSSLRIMSLNQISDHNNNASINKTCSSGSNNNVANTKINIGNIISYDQESNIHQPLLLHLHFPDDFKHSIKVSSGETVQSTKKKLSEDFNMNQTNFIFKLEDDITMIDPLSFNDFPQIRNKDNIIIKVSIVGTVFNKKQLQSLLNEKKIDNSSSLSSSSLQQNQQQQQQPQKVSNEQEIVSGSSASSPSLVPSSGSFNKSTGIRRHSMNLSTFSNDNDENENVLDNNSNNSSNNTSNQTESIVIDSEILKDTLNTIETPTITTSSPQQMQQSTSPSPSLSSNISMSSSPNSLHSSTPDSTSPSLIFVDNNNKNSLTEHQNPAHISNSSSSSQHRLTPTNTHRKTHLRISSLCADLSLTKSLERSSQLDFDRSISNSNNNNITSNIINSNNNNNINNSNQLTQTTTSTNSLQTIESNNNK